VLRHPVAGFAERGVTVQRVSSDNGSADKSHLWRDTCAELGTTVKTRPYRPQTNGKIQRFHRTMADDWTFKKAPQVRVHPPSSPASMDPLLQPPSTPHSNRQGLAHHQIDQHA
jgi:transposase InsO family protein